MSPPNIAERLAQEIDVIDEKTQAALSQIGREEKAAATEEISPIVRRRASITQDDGFRFAQPILRTKVKRCRFIRDVFDSHHRRDVADR
jgi:hypothetical protein